MKLALVLAWACPAFAFTNSRFVGWSISTARHSEASEGIPEPKSHLITLEAFLKVANLVETGGEAKTLIQGGEILLNGEEERRRGKKLYEGDVVVLDDVRMDVAAELAARPRGGSRVAPKQKRATPVRKVGGPSGGGSVRKKFRYGDGGKKSSGRPDEGASGGGGGSEPINDRDLWKGW